MSQQQCMLHFGGKSTPCGGKPCKTCVPSILFKVTIVIFAGTLIGLSGLMLVENNPASKLLSKTVAVNAQRTEIMISLSNIDNAILSIKTDINNIRDQITSDK